MGFRIGRIIKKTTKGNQELIFGEIEEPYMLRSGELMEYAVTYHEGAACGMNNCYSEDEMMVGLEKYNEMMLALVNGVDFYGMYDVLCKKKME